LLKTESPHTNHVTLTYYTSICNVLSVQNCVCQPLALHISKWKAQELRVLTNLSRWSCHSGHLNSFHSQVVSVLKTCIRGCW